jgi:hypothetical protein
MYRVKFNSKIIQEKYFNECQNVIAKLKVRWLITRYGFKEKKYKNKSYKQRSWVYILVGCIKAWK